METMTLRQAGLINPCPSLPSYQESREHNIVLPVSVYKAPSKEEPTVEYQQRLPFIESNTKEISLTDLKEQCIVPVFSKDNELTISHQAFIESVYEAVSQVFPSERILDPIVRVSHPIKGRIPEAIHKPASALLESDKTVFYERMMFCIDIPTIHRDIAGNQLVLQVGGVRAYNEQNLGTRKSAEKFKLFIGFKNMVCCNLCVSSDGYVSNLKAMEAGGLVQSAIRLFHDYSAEAHLKEMESYLNYEMSESQFAQFLGKCRLYQYLPSAEKKSLPLLQLTDTQISLVAKNYYEDPDFCKKPDDRFVSMWNVYNLFTGANKSSYIDNFLDRAQNAGELASGLCKALRGDEEYSWFLS